MQNAIIGILGVLLGIFINELLRRRNRIEGFATRVFDKRLEIYEKLFELVRNSSEIGNDVIDGTNYSKATRHEVVSNAVQELAQYCDENEMYLSEELTIHCVSLLMGVEDIYEIEDEADKKLQIKKFNENVITAKKMIRKEAGIADIESLFSKITKSKLSSPIIDFYKEKKKELGVKGKWE